MIRMRMVGTRSAYFTIFTNGMLNAQNVVYCMVCIPNVFGAAVTAIRIYPRSLKLSMHQQHLRTTNTIYMLIRQQSVSICWMRASVSDNFA